MSGSRQAIEDSLVTFLGRHSRRTNAIYVTALLLVCSGIAALPLIQVDVALAAPGIIRPAADRHEVVTGIDGFVTRVEVTPNRRVIAGQPLVVLSLEPIESRRVPLQARIGEIQIELADLEQLVDSENSGVPRLPLRTRSLVQEARAHQEELSVLDLQIEQSRAEFSRAHALAEEGLAAPAEVERPRFSLERLESERGALVQRRRHAWERRREELRSEARQIEERLAMLHEESLRTVVRAPVSGTIEEMASVSPGSFVRSGDPVAIISPDTSIVAEVFLSPDDFGHLEIGAPARILVDAFNYTDWGFLPGRIAELPEDFILVEGKPVFRTIVELESTELSLPSGITRSVAKGMTFQARFTIARRSLWQLLRDDFNSWLNPLQPPA